MTAKRRAGAVLAVIVALLLPAGAGARLVRTEITERAIIAEGREFGAYGAYEKIAGVFHFEFDPANPRNGRIVDLDLAPTNGAGLVEASANFMILQPVVPEKRRRLGFLEVSNRGSKASLRYFNRSQIRTFNPVAAADFGDGLLMRQGLTIIWVGWQYDIPAGDHRLKLNAPRAGTAAKPLRGLVRSDWTVEETAATLSLGHRTLPTYYMAADRMAPENRLTIRDGRNAPRRLIRRADWRFSDASGNGDGGATHIAIDGGFAPGIYELVYVGQNPVIAGLGLAVIRDVASHAKYGDGSVFAVKNMLGFGVSQTGRFLRHFLYQGFNTDEAGRRVFDGLLIHTAGAGRGSFNHRFAQPSRDAHRFSAFFYPTDLFPFTSEPQPDPVSGQRRGLFSAIADPRHIPKILYTNTGYEYWGRAAGLIHTTLDGRADTVLDSNERIYHLAGGQHYVGAMPGEAERRIGERAYRGNPLEFLVNLRALLVRLAAWVEKRRPPPESRYPRLSSGELVAPGDYDFPAIPGVSPPRRPHTAYVADYGPDWARGIIATQPPALGREIVPPVPAVDNLGNEVSGVRNVELRVPLATFAPWSLRGGALAPEELRDFEGTFIALPRSDAEKAASGDPRPSIAALYKDKADFLARVGAGARALARDGFLLEEDIAYVTARMTALWDFVMAPAAPEKMEAGAQ